MNRFRPNSVLRSGDLNRLGELAERQALQGAAAGQWNNGVGVVVRNPRRARAAAAGEACAAPQWQCSVAVDEAAATVLRVRSGSLGWGGAHVAVWPSGSAVSRAVYGDIALAVPVGETHYVVWYTKSAPVPLVYCPKRPADSTPCGECDDCGTIGAAGDPSAFTPDRGTVAIVSTLTRQRDWTDMRVLATVECTAEGVYKVVQIQTAEIAVNAIVYPGESGEGEAPTCGHPGNDLDDDHPGDDGGSGAGGSYYTPVGGTGHPGDDEGDDGATPECGGEATELDPFAD